MSYRNNLVFNALGLPAYWAECRRARGKMDVTEEIVRYGPHRRQYAVVVCGPGSRPDKVAFYFHGGGWTFGRPESFVPAAIPWLELGFTVVLPSYRRPPEVGLNRIAKDCRAAIAAVLPKGGVTELHVGGISAGAHLAALATLKTEWWLAAGWPAPPSKALLCAGPLDLGAQFPGFVFGRYAHLDPVTLLNDAMPQKQWLLLHGTADGLVGYPHSRKFHEKLVALGQEAELLTLPDGTHLDAGRWMFGGTGSDAVSTFLRTA